jgi:hypothetical protein
LLTCWHLLLEEYGITFGYLPRNKNVVADTLSHLEVNSLKIQEEVASTFIPGSENSSISNIKIAIPIHTALIFNEQTKVNNQGIKRKGNSPTSLLNTTY